MPHPGTASSPWPKSHPTAHADLSIEVGNEAGDRMESDVAGCAHRVAEVRRLFNRAMAAWAQDVLAMRSKGLHKIAWIAPDASPEEDCVFD